MLHDFITEHRDEIIRRSIGKVATPASAADVIDHGVFLNQLSDALRSGLRIPKVARVRFQHRLPLPGLAASVIWQDYFDIRDAITELALAMKAPITVDEFRRLDECLDDAISDAITESGPAAAGIGPDVAIENRLRLSPRSIQRMFPPPSGDY